MTGQRGAASRVSTTVGASAATHTSHWAPDCALGPALPRCPPGGDGRPVAAQNTHPPSRAVVLHLTAKRPWAEVMAGRPDSATSRMLSPFPAQVRPKCGTKCGPVLWRLRCTLHLHRQPDLATVKCVSAAINELYEPSSSPDDIEAWELVMMVAVCVQSAPSTHACARCRYL